MSLVLSPMNKVRALWVGVALSVALLATPSSSHEALQLASKNDIEFDLGESIDAVARRFGKPHRKDLTGNVHMYQYLSLKEGTTSSFVHEGLNIKSLSSEGLLLATDTRFDEGRLSGATINVSTKDIGKHGQAQTALTTLIAQFQHGEWQRYIPDTCPWVTGRSTLLDVKGKVSVGACPLDPTLAISEKEWPDLAAQKLRWQWVGDGRVATLTASYEYYKPSVPTYTINLEFESLEAVKFYAAKRLKEMQAEFGEARVAAGAANGATRIKRLEEAALQRGDSVLPRP